MRKSKVIVSKGEQSIFFTVAIVLTAICSPFLVGKWREEVRFSSEAVERQASRQRNANTARPSGSAVVHPSVAPEIDLCAPGSPLRQERSPLCAAQVAEDDAARQRQLAVAAVIQRQQVAAARHRHRGSHGARPPHRQHERRARGPRAPRQRRGQHQSHRRHQR